MRITQHPPASAAHAASTRRHGTQVAFFGAAHDSIARGGFASIYGTHASNWQETNAALHEISCEVKICRNILCACVQI